MPQFLLPYPELFAKKATKEKEKEKKQKTDWSEAWKFVEGCVEKLSKKEKEDFDVPEVKWASAGADAGMAIFDKFLKDKLKNFAKTRNDPNCNVASNLSPWVNFGHVSMATLVTNVKEALKTGDRSKIAEGAAAYIEEGVVRRELSDNFCYYNAHYDSLKGAAKWASDTLSVHRRDKREHLYTHVELANAKTHDDLWNAAQRQLVEHGKMHGFLRMYWAKKILEWTADAATALEVGLDLNDRYSLDGNDPNGFVGIGWSVMGVHDMGWKEREIFGKIRYMNYQGCQRKFNVPQFVAKYPDGHQSKIPPSTSAETKSLSNKRKSASTDRAPTGKTKKIAPVEDVGNVKRAVMSP
eukprot:Selendium_serpulae@DN5181_c0_g1_i2.p1